MPQELGYSIARCTGTVYEDVPAFSMELQWNAHTLCDHLTVLLSCVQHIAVSDKS